MTNTAKTVSILTDADKALIEADTRRFGFQGDDAVERAIDRETFAVEQFVRGLGVFSTPLVKWQERVAATLTEDGFRFPKVQYHTVTEDGLRSEFERQAAEYEAEWDDDEDHPFRPWDGIETARAFLNASPYTVYRLAERVLRVGRDIVEDSALEIVSGGRVDIAKAMKEVYDEEIGRLLKANDYE